MVEIMKEDSAWKKHLHCIDGIWYARIKPETRGVAISKRMAVVIRAALTQNEKMNPRIPPGEITNGRERTYLAYNCHRLAHELRGLPSDDLDKMSQFQEYVSSEISKLIQNDKNFCGLDTLESQLMTTTLPVVVHIARDMNDRPLHSFVVLGMDENRQFVCFDKQGALYLPFHVLSLKKIIEDYNRNNYAIIVPDSTGQLVETLKA